MEADRDVQKPETTTTSEAGKEQGGCCLRAGSTWKLPEAAETMVRRPVWWEPEPWRRQSHCWRYHPKQKEKREEMLWLLLPS